MNLSIVATTLTYFPVIEMEDSASSDSIEAPQSFMEIKDTPPDIDLPSQPDEPENVDVFDNPDNI